MGVLDLIVDKRANIRLLFFLYLNSLLTKTYSMIDKLKRFEIEKAQQILGGEMRRDTHINRPKRT
jgi:hypothetical protein